MKSLAILFSLFIWSVSAPAKPAPGLSCEDLLAEPPIDEMGLEFAIEYGAFARRHAAVPGRMLQMAQELFEIRLALAQKYKTFFGSQMVEPVAGLPYWQARLLGLADRRVFSFGIREVPRADLVWDYFQKNFHKKGEATHVSTRDFPLYKGEPQVQAEVHQFPYEAIAGLKFHIFALSTGEYYLEHAPDRLVPTALRRLEFLWDRSLDQSLSFEKRRELFAEWEWLWFWTNPFGRAGASVGATLSLLWEIQASEELGRPLWRAAFFHQDLEALSRSLAEYQSWRRLSLTIQR